MKQCPKCGAKYFGGEVFCSLDGEPIVEVGTDMQMPEHAPTEAAEDQFVGQRIEKYDIVRKLGEGGMGEVYEAQHVHIGKRVALKVLREDFSRKEDVVERFRQEARSASIIGHENIIDITDFGTAPDGRFFFVMEYLQGEDLASVLETHPTIPFDRAVRILRQVCAGLVAAHSKGIIHRDLKPENIYLIQNDKGEEVAKLLDFGIAKMSVMDEEGRKLTKTGVIFGTPEYMSPEQASGKPVDERIDVYAIGVIMYEMFTGSVPFTGETFMSILTQHMFEPVPDMKQMNPNLSIPPAMQGVIMKALSKEREDRFSSMAELLEAVETVWADPDSAVEYVPSEARPREPSGTTPAPVTESVTQEEIAAPPSRRTGLVVGLVVAIVLLVGVGVASIFVVPMVMSQPGGSGSTGAAAGGGEAGGGGGETDPSGSGGGTAGDDIVSVTGPDDGVEDEQVTLKVETDPEDTRVDVTGRGTVCDSTPCEIFVDKGDVIEVVLVRGNVEKKDKFLVSADTIVQYTMKAGKPLKKVKKGGKGAQGDGKGGDDGGGGDETPAKKGTSGLGGGDLKIPSVFKKKDESP